MRASLDSMLPTSLSFFWSGSTSELSIVCENIIWNYRFKWGERKSSSAIQIINTMNKFKNKIAMNEHSVQTVTYSISTCFFSGLGTSACRTGSLGFSRKKQPLQTGLYISAPPISCTYLHSTTLLVKAASFVQ